MDDIDKHEQKQMINNEFKKDYVLMAARILNFILKYGFINEEQENN